VGYTDDEAAGNGLLPGQTCIAAYRCSRVPVHAVVLFAPMAEELFEGGRLTFVRNGRVCKGTIECR